VISTHVLPVRSIGSRGSACRNRNDLTKMAMVPVVFVAHDDQISRLGDGLVPPRIRRAIRIENDPQALRFHQKGCMSELRDSHGLAFALLPNSRLWEALVLLHFDHNLRSSTALPCRQSVTPFSPNRRRHGFCSINLLWLPSPGAVKRIRVVTESSAGDDVKRKRRSGWTCDCGHRDPGRPQGPGGLACRQEGQ
jgi:hypothetical protein